MKTKNILYLTIALGLSVGFVACDDDDDYTAYTTPILNENSVVTGSADVTATTAELHATVSGLSGMADGAYKVGFNYGYESTSLTSSVSGTYSDGAISAELTGLTDNTTLYYQAYVTLSSKVTYTGEVKSLVTTDCVVTTADALSIDFAAATVGGSAANATTDASYGIVISSSSDEEAVRAGLIVAAPAQAASFSFEYAGLAPSTTYYYAAYADLGSGVVYGSVKSFTTAAYNVDLENDLVDLGLSVSWARYNVGARSETELGGLYGFGDVAGVSNSIDPTDFASADITLSSLDMATAAWGGVQLPTAADWEELFNLCSTEWTEQDGVAGYKVTGPNGNSIFLPAAGSRTLNSVSQSGVAGVYATGSVNSGNNQYSVAYTFNSGNASRTSVPVYEALSVRPVSTARNVVFNPEYLYKTWGIDYSDGVSSTFAGPVYFYGTDDSWRTISNNEPVVGDSWAWEADYTNTWAFGNCSGEMTFSADGTVSVTYPDGSSQSGTFTLNLDEKTVTATIPLLTPDNFPDQCSNLQNELRIFSLTDESLQIGYYRDADPCLLSVNYIPNTQSRSYSVTLLCVGADWGGTWGDVVDSLKGSDLYGTHTFHYDGSCNGAMVFTLDFDGLNAAFPEAVIYIKEIRCDGQAIDFDGGKLFYGDIEDNGNYRIEFFNIWGKGSNDGVVESPFSDTVGDSDPNFNFAESLEMDYVVLNPTYTPCLITINPSWGGPWDYNQGATTGLCVTADKKLGFTNPTFDITYESTEHADGSIMTFIQTDNIWADFPGVKAQLDHIYLDGVELTGWDADKILNVTADGGGVHHRLELWNMYGETSGNGCAFGEPTDGVISELGFSQSMRVVFTFTSLF
ncbi:MAG: hypothetical protein LIP03_02425 [Bacteroidales bacterium]|nr:hypothetical protein [Bacteroidales bacterium]